MDSRSDTRWIAGRLASIAPPWEPDLVRARTRLADAAPTARRRAWRYGLAAVAATVSVAVAMPPARALAQELWTRWFVTRVAAVRLDLSRLPVAWSIRMGPVVEEVASAGDAAVRAGFVPHLPPEALAGVPTFKVVRRIELTQVIRTAALEEALAGAGATDVVVPREWDGATLRLRVGPVIAASYAGGIEVTQAPPIRLDVPASFPLARFATTVLRAAGMPARQAEAFGAEYAARPAWLLAVPADEQVEIEVVALPRGNGLLIDDLDRDGPLRATVVVSRPTRIYAVSTPSRGQSLEIAAALP